MQGLGLGLFGWGPVVGSCGHGNKPSDPISRMHGTIPPISPYSLMAWCLVKHRGYFTFTF